MGAPSPADGSGQRRRTKEQLHAAWCSSCQRALLGAGGKPGYKQGGDNKSLENEVRNR